MLGAGYDFVLRNGGILDVYDRVKYKRPDFDTYSERDGSDNPEYSLTVKYDAWATNSFENTLGVSYQHLISMAKAVLTPQLTLEWIHEFGKSEKITWTWTTGPPSAAQPRPLSPILTTIVLT